MVLMEYAELETLIVRIREISGFDFSGYARPSLLRRASRYLTTHKMDFPQLLLHIEQGGSVVYGLIQELTVNYSEMFRDPDFFRKVRAEVFTYLESYPTLRFWVAGCATGEEAYSLAILLKEAGFLGRSLIYATDLSNKALTAAREGVFTPADAQRMAYVRTDVADEAQGQAAVEVALQRFGRLDVLVNAAGVGPAEKIFGKNGPHRLESFARTIQINLIGTFNMMRLAVPAMAGSGPAGAANDASASQGVIVNTASVAAFDGQIGQAAYAASKGGVVAMTLPAARELARERIRVMTIAPGIFETPMLLGLPQEVQDSLGRSVPHPARLGRPAEYAALVRSIVDNEYLNGEVIRLDGAIRMAAK